MNRSVLFFFAILIGFTAAGYAIVEVFENNMALAVYGPENHMVHDFALTDQLNQPFNSTDQTGKIWIVNCFFTSCPIVCPKVMKNLQEVHDYIRKDDEIVTISMTVDPKRDTPAQLLDYAHKYNANNDSWFLLTGEKKTLYRIARKEFLLAAAASDGTDEEDDFIHSENIMIIDPDHRIRNIINGTSPDADQMVLESVKKLKKEYKL